MRFKLPFAAISIALLLAACQTGGQKDAPVTGAATGAPSAGGPAMSGPATSGPATGGPATRNSAERNAVVAFSRICGLLNRDAVVQRAAQFGFVPAPNDALPADLRSSFERANGLMLIRPGGAPTMLMWSEPPMCELWVGGVRLPEMEREFSQFLDRVDEVLNSRNTVTRLSPDEAARMGTSNGSRVRQGAFIMPRELVATRPRVMVLRARGESDVFQALMIHSTARPAQGAPVATTSPTGQPKDPVR